MKIGVVVLLITLMTTGCVQNTDQQTLNHDGESSLDEKYNATSDISPDDVQSDSKYLLSDVLARDINETFGLFLVLSDSTEYDFDSRLLIDGINLTKLDEMFVKNYSDTEIIDKSTTLFISSYSFDDELETNKTYVVHNAASHINSIMKVLVIENISCKITVCADETDLDYEQYSFTDSLIYADKYFKDNIHYSSWIEFDDLKETDNVDDKVLKKAEQIRDELISLFSKYKPNFEPLNIEDQDF